MNAFQRQEIQVRELTPLEGIDFACPEAGMNFNTFQIRRFSAAELAEILGSRVNHVFYPRAMLDVKQLQDYWFISTQRLEPHVHRGFNLKLLDQIQPEYERFSGPFGSPHQILALFAWEKYWRYGEGWEPPGFFFTLQVNDDFLSLPPSAPNLSRLSMEPKIDHVTGEEIGERRAIWIDLYEDGTSQFKAFVQHVEDLFGVLKLREWDWEFFERAQAYFMKAFQSTDLEQLLWHITVIESLLGEKREGVTDRLGRRLSTILGSTKGQREDIRKRFKELYEFRSDLVHGNRFKKQVLVNHLTTGRIFARKTLLWFLHYLHAARPRTSEKQETRRVPSRDVLLANLDLDESTRQLLRELMDRLPLGFPYTQEWIE